MGDLTQGEIIDITMPIEESMVIYPGNDGLAVNRLNKIKEGDSSNLTEISMTVHTGTHLDAPLHFVEEGDAIDELPLQRFMGRCQVIEIEDPEAVTADELKNKGIDEDFVLFKTVNSQLAVDEDFRKDYVVVSKPAARYLIDQGVKLVGVDYLSVEGFGESEVHQLILGNGLVILEGLRLAEVEEGQYTLVALPLKITGSEGSPTRAVLVRN